MNIQENKYVNETTISIKKEIYFNLLSRGLDYKISNLFIIEKVQEKLNPYNVLVKELKQKNYDNTYEFELGIECVMPVNSNIDKIDQVINKTLNLIGRFVKNKKSELNAIKVKDDKDELKRSKLVFEKYELETVIKRQRNKIPKYITNDVVKKRL